METATSVNSCEQQRPLSDDRYRPLLHFTPTTNWMNDPNGLVKATDGYHLFYQHNPCANTWGDIVWGHATSNDMLQWEDHGVSLAPGEVMAFSGSAAECDASWVGVSGAGKRVIVAAYTGHDPGDDAEDQRIAYSLDAGHSWRHLTDGPVIDRASHLVLRVRRSAPLGGTQRIPGR